MAELPSSSAWNTLGRWKKCGAPQPPTRAEAEKGRDGWQRSSSLKAGGPSPAPTQSPRRAPRGRPRGGGAWEGALTSHPSPSGRWRFREHPARSSAAGGGGSRAARSPTAERGGEERAWAHGRHPHAAPRASEAPHAQGRAGAPEGRRPRVAGERADSRSVSPSPSPFTTTPHRSHPLRAADSALT